MKNFIWESRIFLFLYFLFVVAGAVIILKFERGSEILYFNSLHHAYSDELFKWITRMAEGPFLTVIVLLIFTRNFGNGMLLFINIMLIFIFVHLFKQILFSSEIRPSVFFEGKEYLNFVDGVDILRYNSFPSGHTAVAFGVFFMLSVFVKNKVWSVLLFALALLVGISRVYLLEHFFRDVYFGSVVGITVTLIFYSFIHPSKFFKNLKWKDKFLLKR